MTAHPVLRLDADDVEASMSPTEAIDVIAGTLLDGFDPARDPERWVLPVSRGQLLVMPAEVGGRVGVKIVTHAPQNAGTARPRIQGLFLLFDTQHLEPVALIDGPAMTTLRTAAVSIAAVRPRLLADRAPLNVVVFGAGPQAFAHVRAVRSVLQHRRTITSLHVLVRREPIGLPPLDGGAAYLRIGTPAANEALRRSDLVICATSSAEPVFDSSLLQDSVIVTAVGSHETDRRELDSALMARAQVIVEDVGTALREAGDVVIPIGESRLSADDLVPMSAALSGAVPFAEDRPVVFKSVGMSWQDVAIATALERNALRSAELVGRDPMTTARAVTRS